MEEAAESLNSVFRKVKSVNDGEILASCYYLNQIGEMINDYSHLYDFLRWLYKLAWEELRSSTASIVRLLHALCQMSHDTLMYTLRIGYLRSIHCLQMVVRSTHHLTILSMWVNYVKHWNKHETHHDVLAAKYDQLLRETRNRDPPDLKQEIAVLHGFSYFSYYSLKNDTLSMRLLVEMLDKCGQFLEDKNEYEWSFETQAFAFASKATAMLFEKKASHLAGSYLEKAILILERGDRECRTRAVALIEELILWCERTERHNQVESLREKQNFLLCSLL
ncbi:conserved hypothetical protein [Talaromyces stipitatus ATCC 10500]|uniref:Uncharacterized protein n=1 Tax=Talaromyces stipitatus (strain ATCC 10500 / CBS 375.48 / QM 6759 / NRRL 1006) TaxID=441959 RepID=B8MN61_TALSN|nr:uncharacterized protein TSTA_107170 [Talaromyces stipitatus ATCC 10500]EED14510.1 conserved hypothetical protein [Talaromyces stipitatus ATCC 10500]